MSGYLVLNKDKTMSPVHNLATGLYLVKIGKAIEVIDQWSGRGMK